jgi:hypothetical protein
MKVVWGVRFEDAADGLQRSLVHAQLVREVGMGRGGEGVLVWVLAQKVQGIGNVDGAVGGGEVYCASQVNLQPPRQVSVGIHFRREIST